MQLGQGGGEALAGSELKAVGPRKGCKWGPSPNTQCQALLHLGPATAQGTEEGKRLLCLGCWISGTLRSRARPSCLGLIAEMYLGL